MINADKKRKATAATVTFLIGNKHMVMVMDV